MKALFSLVLLTVVFLASSGCTDGSRSVDVLVVDEWGVPLEDAAVEPVTHSINRGAVATDEKGRAWMAGIGQDVQWVTVRKDGYEVVMNQQYDGVKKPVKVVLVKEKP